MVGRLPLFSGARCDRLPDLHGTPGTSHDRALPGDRCTQQLARLDVAAPARERTPHPPAGAPAPRDERDPPRRPPPRPRPVPPPSPIPPPGPAPAVARPAPTI